MKTVELDLLQHIPKLKVKTEGTVKFIWDPIRKIFLTFQPEELVRQLFVQHLISIKYPKGRTAMERGIQIFGALRRYDIVVFSKDGSPYLIVECKGFDVPLSQFVLEQIGLYNLQTQAPYLCITNGKSTIVIGKNHEGDVVLLDHLPTAPIQ